MSVDSDRSKAAVAVRGQSTPACPSRRDSADEGGLLSSLLFFPPGVLYKPIPNITSFYLQVIQYHL